MNIRTFLFVALLVVGLPMTACTANPAQPAAPVAATETATEVATEAAAGTAAEATTGVPGIALVLIGPKDDNSWAAAAYSALEAQAAKGAKTAFSESVADTDAARVMSEYAEQGFPIVIAHSFSYQDPVFEVASQYPDANFAWAGGINRTAKNVADYDQPFYQAAYLAGILGGYMAKDGKLGALYGFDIPVCHSMGEAMLAGAKTVNPDATLTPTAVGDWGDVQKAKEAGVAQADTAGVNFWLGCGEGPTLVSIEAAKEKGGYATGYVGDMSKIGPDVVLSSIVWNMDPIFDAISTQTADGTFDAPYYQFGVKEGALDLVINPALADKVPPEALQAIETAKAAIKDGTLTVPFVPQ